MHCGSLQLWHIFGAFEATLILGTYFANTPNGANASTMIYSIIQSAILNNLIPQKYLTFVFDIIQSGRDASSLVPWSNEIPESCKKGGVTRNESLLPKFLHKKRWLTTTIFLRYML